MYTETELISLYEDLLAQPALIKPEDLSPQARMDESSRIVRNAASRILPDDSLNVAGPSVNSLAQQLRRLRGVSLLPHTDVNHLGGATTSYSAPLHIALLDRVEQVLSSLEHLRTTITAPKTKQNAQTSNISFGLMVGKEWAALVRYCVSVCTLTILPIFIKMPL